MAREKENYMSDGPPRITGAGPTTGACTCAHFPDDKGRLLPQAWIAAHETVCVVGRNGRTATGWTTGLQEATFPEGRELVLVVEVPGGDDVIFAPDDIATCTPVKGLVEPEDFAQAVGRAVARAIVGDDVPDDWITFISSEHVVIDVDVRRRDLDCIPGGTVDS